MKILTKVFKWMLLILIIVISFLIAYLNINKYFSTKDISDDSDNLSIKNFQHKNITFKYGSKGDFLVLEKSYNGKSWEKVSIGNFWINMFPDNFNYYSMTSIQNTIWIDCFHSCHQSDCETFIYDYFYSHDNGNTWHSLNDKIGYDCYALSFINDKVGTCYYEIDNKIIHLITKDGGKTWQENNSTKQ